MYLDDLNLELARIFREAEAAVTAKLASRNLGEAFVDLETSSPRAEMESQ